MLWFNSEEKKKRMKFIENYVPTSKASLLQVAMWYHRGNIDKAQEMVDFYTKNMDLPDFDPVPPTLIQQIRDNATGLFGFIRENQNEIVQGYQFIQGIIKNKGVLPVAAEEATALPPIND